MNKKYIFGSIAALVMALPLTSCNDYLDELPDNRAAIDEEYKVTSLLVSAYPTANYALMAEMYSDNTDQIDVASYTAYQKVQEQAATWTDITEKEDDTPYQLWNACYMAIASANHALQAIEEMGNPATLQGEKAEALMCRAYSHWVLTNIFTMGYSPVHANEDAGIPYATEPETTVKPDYQRGTVAQDYELMAKDIQEALPLLNDDHLEAPKYHFNKKAAYAFAARFYLFYVQQDKSNYQKVIDYANVALGANAALTIRDWATVGAKAVNGSVRAMAFTNSSDPANLMLYSTYSLWARYYGPYGIAYKYCHGNAIRTYESCAATPWGTYSYYNFSIPTYSQMPKVIMAKMAEYFEYTDKVNGIGFAHVIYPALTTDEVLLTRAEAYAMLGRYEESVDDLNTWAMAFYKSNTNRKIKTVDDIVKFYGDPEYNASGTLTSGMAYYTPFAPTPKKELHPDFTVEAGTQEAFIHCILACRRMLTLHEGKRWFDVKRYGMKIYRRLVNGTTIEEVTDSLDVRDPRRAIQLPQSVIGAGVEANPRDPATNDGTPTEFAPDAVPQD